MLLLTLKTAEVPICESFVLNIHCLFPPPSGVGMMGLPTPLLEHGAVFHASITFWCLNLPCREWSAPLFTMNLM